MFMASKKSILVAALMAIGALTAPAQDISGNLSVFCGATSIVITNATGCKAPYPYTGQIVNPGAYTPSTQTNCHVITVYVPYYTGEWITETEADLVDGICCIPFFWGQWWQNWGPSQLFPNSPDPVLSYYNLSDSYNLAGGANGVVITAVWPGGAGPITDAATACRAYAEGLLYQDLTEDMIIGAVPEWTCPCAMPPVMGDGCPEGWGGMGWGGGDSEWGTIWATGYIHVKGWQYITIYEALTYYFPGQSPTIGPVTPQPPPNQPNPNPGPNPTNNPVNPIPTNNPVNPNPNPTNNPVIPPPIIIITNGYPTNIIPTNPIPVVPNPTNTTPCLVGIQIPLILNIQQWLNNTLDPQLEIAPVQSTPQASFWGPFPWTSPNGQLYGGLTSGYVSIAVVNDYMFLEFGALPNSLTSALTPSTAAIIQDQTPLIALAAANGVGMSLADELDYGLEHYNPGLTPTTVNGVTAIQLPTGSLCTTIGYQWPTGPIIWPNGSSPADDIELQTSLLCPNTGHPNQQQLTLTWSSTNLSNLAFFSTDPDARAYLPTTTNLQANGSVVIEGDFDLSGFGLSGLEITLAGIDTDGFVYSISTTVQPTGGQVSVSGITTNLTTTPAGNYASWTLGSLTTDQDPTSGPTCPLVTIWQQGDPYPLLSQYVKTPANNITFGVTATAPVTLTIDDSCGMFTNTMDVPTNMAPEIFEYGLYPNPNSPTLLTPSTLGSIGNPGTVLYEITNQTPGTNITYSISNTETGFTMTGTFSNAVLWLTNNIRAVVVSASASPGSAAASAAAPLTHIYVETPEINLPPVLYNDTNIVFTNYVQFNSALFGENLQLNCTLPMTLETPPPQYSFGYLNIANFGSSPSQQSLPAGAISIFVGGNNQTNMALNSPTNGYWTNTLYNSSMPDQWYNYTPDAPAGAVPSQTVPLQPTGETNAGTVFDVFPILYQTNGCVLTAASLTTNATLSLVQLVDGQWVTNESSTPSLEAAASFNFGCVDLGYPSVLVGTRPFYNPTETSLPLEVVFYVTESPCGAFVTFNHAITNVIVQGLSTNGTETNYTYAIPPFDALSETIPLTNDPGSYLIYGFPIDSAAPSITNFSIAESSSWTPEATGGAFTEEGTTGRYMLVASTNSLLTLSIITDNDNMQLMAQAPWQSNNVNSAILDLSTVTNSTSFSTTNLVAIPGCLTNQLPIDIVLNLGGLPPFDIPVSTITTNDCLDFLNGTPTINIPQ